LINKALFAKQFWTLVAIPNCLMNNVFKQKKYFYHSTALSVYQ